MTTTNRIFLIGILTMFCSDAALAYNYHLDRDIRALSSRGTVLTKKYRLAEQQLDTLRAQEKSLDQTKQQLDTSRNSYDKSANVQRQQIVNQNKATQEVKDQCNDSDISANTSGHVNWCNNKISAVNAKSKEMAANTQKLQKQQFAINSRTQDLNKQVAQWNHDQMLAVSVFNDASTRLNDWLNDAYAFMNTTDFQYNITWAHAGKRCEDNGAEPGGTPEQALYNQAEHAIRCLNDVESARKKYYKTAR